jgi:hypothetical protein
MIHALTPSPGRLRGNGVYGRPARELHPSDAAVIAHHSAFHRRLAPGAVARSVEFGAGPNLYPLILASAASRHVDAVEAGAGNVAHLHRQIVCGPDASRLPFHALCRRLDPDLPRTLAGSLAQVHVVHADVRDLEPGGYGLASMHFVAEGATEDFAEFADFCRAFARCVVPGGHLVAAFMENMPTYRIGPTSRWPGCPVSPETVTEVFAPPSPGHCPSPASTPIRPCRTTATPGWCCSRR